MFNKFRGDFRFFCQGFANGVNVTGAKRDFSKTDFCHQSGRHWPDLDDTLGFESWSPGPHFGPIPGPRGAQKRPEKSQKLLGNFHGFQTSEFCVFRVRFGPPGRARLGQNVAPRTSFRTPKYRPNPANGGPTGGEKPFSDFLKIEKFLCCSVHFCLFGMSI